MAIAPWGVIGMGKLRTDAEEEERAKSGENGRTALGDWRRNEHEVKVSHALEKVAKEIGAKSITSIAIAWIMQKVPYVFPIIGGRKVEHLHANIEALKITLTEDQIKELESVLPFDPGFPYNFFVSNIVCPYIIPIILYPVHRETAPTIMQRLRRVVGSISGQRQSLSALSSNRCIMFI
jgi:hypothetical protein